MCDDARPWLACDAAETAIADARLLTLELGDRRPCHAAAAEGS